MAGAALVWISLGTRIDSFPREFDPVCVCKTQLRLQGTAQAAFRKSTHAAQAFTIGKVKARASQLAGDVAGQ